MLHCQKESFSLEDEVTYLNCAYMSPQLQSVEQVGLESIRQKSRPYQMGISDFFDPVIRLQKLFAELIHCPKHERIAIIPAASYGVANVAANIQLQAGQEILIIQEQFPSNYHSWERLAKEQKGALKVIPQVEAAALGGNWTQAILNNISDQTALVAIGHVHWADGSRFDLELIGQKCRQHEALLVIDGTQSVGALTFDVQKIQPDALICGGYKWLLGPYSLGLAYYGPAFDHGLPIEENWINRLHSEDFKSLVQYQTAYKPGAQRYSMGEQSNFILIPMLQKALEQILAWGVENIQVYCQHISKNALERLEALECLIAPEAYRCHHLFGIRLGPNIDVLKLQQVLVREKVYVSFRGNAVRVAPHLYNDVSDFEKLVYCFEQAVR